MKTAYQILRDKVKMNNFTFVEQEAICAAMEEYSAQFNKPPVYGQWIDVKKRLPNVGQRVIWKGVLKWQSKPNDVSYFDDELTGETEALEYGGIGYRLKDNSDYLAIPHDTDYWDEILVEWQPLPPSPGSVDVEEKKVDGLGDSSGSVSGIAMQKAIEFVRTYPTGNTFDYRMGFEAGHEFAISKESVKEVSREGEKAEIERLKQENERMKDKIKQYEKPKKQCPKCGSDNVVMFTPDLDLCRNCDNQFI